MLFHEMKSIRIHWVTTPLRVWTLKHKKEFVLGKVSFKIKKRYKLSHFWSGPSCSILWAGKTKHSFMGMEGKKNCSKYTKYLYIFSKYKLCFIEKGLLFVETWQFFNEIGCFSLKTGHFSWKNVVFHWKIGLLLFFNIW